MSQITRIDVVPSSQREEAPPVDGRTSVASVTGVYEDVIVDREKAMDALSIDDELAATMPSTEALDHFDSQWHSYGTHMSPLHFAASLGKRRYLSLLLKQLHHSNLSERNLARLEHLRQRGQTHGLNMLAVTGRYSTQSNFLCAYIHTGDGGRAHLFMITQLSSRQQLSATCKYIQEYPTVWLLKVCVLCNMNFLYHLSLMFSTTSLSLFFLFPPFFT